MRRRGDESESVMGFSVDEELERLAETIFWEYGEEEVEKDVAVAEAEAVTATVLWSFLWRSHRRQVIWLASGDFHSLSQNNDSIVLVLLVRGAVRGGEEVRRFYCDQRQICSREFCVLALSLSWRDHEENDDKDDGTKEEEGRPISSLERETLCAHLDSPLPFLFGRERGEEQEQELEEEEGVEKERSSCAHENLAEDNDATKMVAFLSPPREVDLTCRLEIQIWGGIEMAVHSTLAPVVSLAADADDALVAVEGLLYMVYDKLNLLKRSIDHCTRQSLLDLCQGLVKNFDDHDSTRKQTHGQSYGTSSPLFDILLLVLFLAPEKVSLVGEKVMTRRFEREASAVDVWSRQRQESHDTYFATKKCSLFVQQNLFLIFE
jgi:hypothetical protein